MKRKVNKNTKKYQKKLLKRFDKKQLLLWSIGVKNRDGNKCVICGSTERLNAHHIIPRSIKSTRFEICNGISLCPLHHNFDRHISAHKGSFAFYIWFEKNRPEQFRKLLELSEGFK